VQNPLTVRASVLQALLAGPAYGAELIQRFGKGIGARLTPGRVYPILRELEEGGLVTVVAVAPRGRRGARTRLYYALTPTGIAEADAERALLRRLLIPASPAPVNDAERRRMADRVVEGEALSEAALALVDGDN
jgi:DNA-binding PadR family transcriptional regulator